MFSFLDKYRDFGLLVLRCGFGGMFMAHGIPKLLAGPEMWAKLGGAMGMLGIESNLEFWGFMAAFAEAGGGLCLILGIFFRTACLLMTFTMVIATAKHIKAEDHFSKISHAAEAGIVFFSMFFMGTGPHTILKLFKFGKDK